MNSLYEILWLFFVASFGGWILETTTAAFKQRRFVNRGLINGPFCVIYGFVTVFLDVFFHELDGIWLFMAGFIASTLFEWIAGHLIEKVYKEKWWDYSDIKYNLDGYICLPMSLLWGALSFIMVKWGNDFVVSLYRLLPNIIGIIIWILVIYLVLDIVATLMIYNPRWHAIDKWLDKHTNSLSQKIYTRINKRITNAYPKAKQVSSDMEYDFNQLIWLFAIGSFLGCLVEMVYCRMLDGYWSSRSSLVWGDFSVVWGLALVLATLLLHRYRDKSDGFLFMVGVFLGGAYEYICSVFTELVFGKVFWDYSNYPLNLGGRINLLYCFFWGIAAVLWMKKLYPVCEKLITKVPVKLRRNLSIIFTIFMCINVIVSGLALIRGSQREDNVPAESSWQRMMDKHFDDEKLFEIYPNMM